MKPDAKRLAKAWLDDHQEELALFREAAAHSNLGVETVPLWAMSEEFRELFHLGDPGVRDLDSEDLFSILLPHTQATGGIGRALFTNLTRAADQGDGKAAYSDLIAILGVARHAGEHPILICCMVEIAIRRMATKAIHETLRDHPALWSDRQLQEIAHDLALAPRPLRFYLKGELALALDFVQRVYSQRGELTLSGLRRLASYSDDLRNPLWLMRSTDSSLLSRLGEYLALPGFAIALSDREETTCLLASFFDSAIQDAELPLWESDEDFKENETRRINESKNFIATLITPATASARKSYERSEGLRHGALIGIALELYRRDAGKWPESLDALVPRWIPELPVDPINGGPLGYRIVEGKPVVYSLGRDGDDDGGVLPAACDPDAEENVGYRWGRYRPGPPLDRPMTKDSRWWEDGDWVFWSLGEPRYMPETAGESAD